MINKKIRAYTLVETLTAMTLLTLCFSGMFVSIYYAKTGIPDVRRLKARNEMAALLARMDVSKEIITGEYPHEEFNIYVTAQPYNNNEQLMKVETVASDANGKVLTELKRLIYLP